MEELNNGSVFSIDYLLSRPDPIQRHMTSFYGPHQPRGFQVRQHVSASSSGDPEGESKSCPCGKIETERKRAKQGKRQYGSSPEDELDTTTSKRCAHEALELLSKHDLEQVTTPYYQNMSQKTPLISSKRFRGYSSDVELNPEPGSVTNRMDMGRRRDCQSSCLEQREEVPEDALWSYSTESFAEEYEDFTNNNKNEFTNQTEAQVDMTIDGVTVSLQNSDLWTEFHYRGTEMIINRAGRRMFPRISVTVTGLKPHVVYHVLLFFERSDRRRYKFVNGKWHTTQIMELQETSHIYTHPDSPNTGSFWMKESICFSKLKITNNPEQGGSNVFLQSMYKYIPHIIIKENDASDIDKNFNDSSKGLQTLSSHSRNCYKFCFPITSFVAVTAYQNEKITDLKIKNNPFAKAFRDAGKPSLQHCFFGSGNIPQDSQNEEFPLYHPLRNAESLGCMPTSSLPFQDYNWPDARILMTKSLLQLSGTSSLESRNVAAIEKLTRKSRLYSSNTYLAAERSPYLRNHSSSITSVRSRLSSSTNSVLWEHDSAYGSLNSVHDHHV